MLCENWRETHTRSDYRGLAYYECYGSCVYRRISNRKDTKRVSESTILLQPQLAEQ